MITREDVYNEAVRAIEENSKWPSNKKITLADGIINDRKAEIYLKNKQGKIVLTVFVEGQLGSKQLLTRKYFEKIVGWFVPVSGWQVALNSKECNNWFFSVEKRLGF